MSEQTTLGYEQIEGVASRDDLRAYIRGGQGKRGRETYMIPFGFLKEREGFNARVIYEGIDELALSIMAQGLVTPLTIDFMKEGIAYVERGHRRFAALRSIFQSEGNLDRLNGKPGVSEGMIECFINPRETTEIDRIKRILSSNDGKELTPYEKARVAKRLKDVYKMQNQKIGEILGLSRQQIDNYIMISNGPETLLNAMKEGQIAATEVIKISRQHKDPKDRELALAKKMAGESMAPPKDNLRVREEKIWNDIEGAAAGEDGEEIPEIKMCRQILTYCDKMSLFVSRTLNEGLIMDMEYCTQLIERNIRQIVDYLKSKK